MANPHAGEVEVVVDGVPRTAKLTLGALAELEASLGDDTMIALVHRIEELEASIRRLQSEHLVREGAGRLG